VSERRAAPTVLHVAVGRRPPEARGAAGPPRARAGADIRLARSAVARCEGARTARNRAAFKALVESHGLPAARAGDALTRVDRADRSGWRQRRHDAPPGRSGVRVGQGRGHGPPCPGESTDGTATRRPTGDPGVMAGRTGRTGRAEWTQWTGQLARTADPASATLQAHRFRAGSHRCAFGPSALLCFPIPDVPGGASVDSRQSAPHTATTSTKSPPTARRSST
jgi:hypothetical protein